MGIAYSQRAIVTGQIRTATLGIFLSDVDIVMAQAGWQKIREIPNGAVYQCFTPDKKLSAKLQVAEGASSFGGTRVAFTPLSANEINRGFDYFIIYGNPDFPVYQVIVGVCQFFLSIPTLATSPYHFDQSSCFAFGIPFVNNLNNGVTDIWWANGDGGGPFFVSEHFRISPRCFMRFNYCLNGVMFSSVNNADPSQGMLTLFYLAPTWNLDTNIGQTAFTTKFKTGQPINLDALVGWQHVVQGQLWDAFQRTQAEPLDAIQSYKDTDSDGNPMDLKFQVWMSSFYDSLLLLQTTVSPGGGNVAY